MCKKYKLAKCELIITFARCMKANLLKISALLLVLWYSLSVIGFDIHTCHGSGNVYVATVLGGTATCGDHASEGCHCCCSAHAEASCESIPAEEDHPCVSEEPCCSDYWQVIQLTGVRGCDSDDLEAYLQFFPVEVSDVSTIFQTYHSGLMAFCETGPQGRQSRDILQMCSIWRI